MLFLGRGNCFPIALEGALKLKEISYIHAEGYAAGEMKHGPIALIDPAVPVIAIAPSGPLFEKTASNLQEAAARGGQVIVFSDAAGAAKLTGHRGGDGGAAGGRSVRGADPVCDSGADAGVSCGGAEGHGCGPAAEPGEVGDGGVGRLRTICGRCGLTINSFQRQKTLSSDNRVLLLTTKLDQTEQQTLRPVAARLGRFA